MQGDVLETYMERVGLGLGLGIGIGLKEALEINIE